MVLVGPPGYFWKQGPIRDAVEDLDFQVMRMRFCHLGLRCDRSGQLPCGQICKWQLLARTSRPICGGA
eukprot:4823632-Pyramimonas_sp.AAC.1